MRTRAQGTGGVPLPMPAPVIATVTVSSDLPSSAAASSSGQLESSPPPRRWPAAGMRALAGRSQTAQDLFFGALAVLLWAGPALKMAPFCSAAANAQTALGMLAICAISLAWPLLATASYERWRVPALSGLRLFLLCLPVNFQVTTFDALAPSFVSGRLSWIANVMLVFTSTHMDMLLFTALGWRLPLRVHMPLQAACIAILLRFGLRTHLDTQLLSSPEAARWALGIHGGMAFLTELFLPTAALLVVPQDRYRQVAALLCFFWLMVGWLLPTMLLRRPNQSWTAADGEADGIRQRQQQQQQQQQGGVAGSGAAAAPAACSKQLRCVWAAAAAAAGRLGDFAEAGLAFLAGAPLRGPFAAPPTSPQRQPPPQQASRATAELAEREAVRPAALAACEATTPFSLLPRWLPLVIGTWMACCAAVPVQGAAGVQLP